MNFVAIISAIIGRGKNGLFNSLCKAYTVKKLCDTPELSDEKVKHITNMML